MNHTSIDHAWFQRARRGAARVAGARLVRVVGHRRPLSATRGSSSSTPRPRTGRGTRSPASTTGTGSSHTSLTSTTRTPMSRRRCSTCCGSGSTSGSTGSGSTRCRTCSSGRGPTARTCPRPTRTSSASGARSTRAIPDRVLLAEANQWPADVVQYFGDGDECHMAFQFPVMPRMFMAMRREESDPVYEILEQTPPIPETSQWGLFLRNHDELTLEMVTDEERDYMYSEYAKDPRMKLNLGIRRRLAPLLDNGRDEIAADARDAVLAARVAGPLLRRRDRDGRQHVPRRPRRRAHPDAVVGRPQRRVLARGLRAAVRAAGDGPGLRVPGAQHRGAVADPHLGSAVAAPARSRCARSIRCSGSARSSRSSRRTPGCSPICAGSRTISYCAFTTSRVPPRRSSSTCARSRAGYPVELFGRARFPRIGELPYLLTLGARGFYWFELAEEEAPMADSVRARVDVGRLVALEELPEWLQEQRWYASKSRSSRRASRSSRARCCGTSRCCC